VFYPRIRVLSDRIEFFNPGSLPKAVKYILKEEFSMPRNNVIARIFRTIRLSENMGSGFYKMFHGWNAYYAKKPVVEGDFDYYKIMFYLEKKPEALKGGQISGQISGQKIKLSARQEELLELIRKNPSISRKEISETIKINQSAIQRHLDKLKQKGIIKRIGPDKGGKWKVMQ
jgi:ATP-dependent DNA helicase RecG